jgi:hypothetical protein
MPEVLSLFEDVLFDVFQRSTAWQAFFADPEWITAWRDRSDPENPMVAEVSSEILIPLELPRSAT